MFNGKKILKVLADDAEQVTKVTMLAVADYNTETDDSIKELKISGDFAEKGDANYPTVKDILHVGIFSNDMSFATLKIRVHGKNWFDGKEFENLLKTSGSKCYGGAVDDKKFLFRFAMTRPPHPQFIKYGQFISSDNIKFKLDTSFDFHMPIEITKRQTYSPLIFYTNLGVFHANGTVESMQAKPNAVGSSLIECTSLNTFSTLEMVLYPTIRGALSFNIYYDGAFCMKHGATELEKTEKYNGFSEFITMKFPLTKITNPNSGSEYADTLNAKEGTILRKNEFLCINSKSEISIVENGGVKFFAIKLPKRASRMRLVQSNFAMSHINFNGFLQSATSACCISEGQDNLYVKIPNITDIEDFRSKMMAKKCYAFYVLETPYTESVKKIDKQPQKGYVAIEACAYPNAKIEVVHT